MSELKTYHFATTVVATAPKGYKPRTITVKGLGVSNKPNAAALIRSQAEVLIKKNFAKTFPNVEFEIKASLHPVSYEFFIVDNLEAEESKEVKPDTVLKDGELVPVETTPEVLKAPASEGDSPEVPEVPASEETAPEVPEVPASEETAPEVPEVPANEETAPEVKTKVKTPTKKK